MDCFASQQYLLDMLASDTPTEENFFILYQGSNCCNYQRRSISGILTKESRKYRMIECSKCKQYKSKFLLVQGQELALKIETSKIGWLFHKTRSNLVVLDDFSYDALASWVAASVADGILEVFDIWSCSTCRNIAREECEEYDNCYEEEFTNQLPDLFRDLQAIDFRSRRLTKDDFFVRMVAFSYKDEKGKHRSGSVKLCLKVPIESSFKFGGKNFTSLTALNTTLYSTTELESFLY